MNDPAKLLMKIRRELRRIADPDKARGMQAYMKSDMPYHGVAAPAQRRLFREGFAAVTFEDADSWRAAIIHIWRHARFREERYFGIAFCQYRHARAFHTPDALAMFEELIVTGAWWDFVDTLASHNVGLLLKLYPGEIAREMRAWSRSENMWKRRTAILCQLGFKQSTSLPLLYSCIGPSLGSREFFLQKAIGWALRQYAWSDPREVRRYVREHEHVLSPLSKREALKNIVRRSRSPGAGRAR
jgi:3-methyladenine DNA glycosylase AlkD